MPKSWQDFIKLILDYSQTFSWSRSILCLKENSMNKREDLGIKNMILEIINSTEMLENKVVDMSQERDKERENKKEKIRKLSEWSMGSNI